MTYYYYRFADGYYCYRSRMNYLELKNEEAAHGELVEMKKVRV